MKDKRILITGGAGLVGSHIADLSALERPKSIVVLDNFSRGRRSNLNQAMAVCDRISLLEKGRLVFDGTAGALAASGLIERVFNVRGRFVSLGPGSAPHFDVEIGARPPPSVSG